ncbi:hypothetical protein EV385_1157 [Krasilnikovia cinnamomea]|uniref:Uncharacterized protein n=1 Tax=Krasilnikovia cinnamomea TaxID=349313 RepID=A0A4Q7ZFA2_9ACTN|nr:hypothetical protein [Krasilnikovia cinnamomea]RZU49407.1 hypothetical protein EV385_1157 [Krasilnikovia cinnamomea]
MVEAEIRIESADADVESLWLRLGEIPELRGHLRLRGMSSAPGTMGAETVIGVMATAAVLARACTPMVQAVLDYLKERARLKRSDVVIVSGPNGKAQLSVSNTADPARLVREALGVIEPGP